MFVLVGQLSEKMTSRACVVLGEFGVCVWLQSDLI